MENLNFAVLIDGDNIPSAYVKEMMEEIAKYGNPTIKRIYGDWTKPHLSKWKNLLLENAITPIQQYGYTTGKNATDSAMIIDAMDILYSGKVTGFCIVSSDSDFTRLAVRLREAAMHADAEAAETGCADSARTAASLRACYGCLVLSASTSVGYVFFAPLTAVPWLQSGSSTALTWTWHGIGIVDDIANAVLAMVTAGIV